MASGRRAGATEGPSLFRQAQKLLIGRKLKERRLRRPGPMAWRFFLGGSFPFVGMAAISALVGLVAMWGCVDEVGR